MFIPALAPPAIDFQPYLDIRSRYERRANVQFAEGGQDDRSDFLNRGMAGFTFQADGGWSGDFHVLYAHGLRWTAAENTGVEDVEIGVAYVQNEQPWGRVRAGRQKVVVGRQRLFGIGDWSNLPRSVDAVRLETPDWDVFALQVAVAPVVPDARYYAVGHKFGPDSLYVIYKDENTAMGDINHFTANAFGRREFGRGDVFAELMAQSGRTQGRDHEAWAGHVNVGYRPDAITRFFGEVNIASGGPPDGTSRTFDQLIAGNHDNYGYMDLQGFKNLVAFTVGMERQIAPRVTGKLHLHSFSLYDARDAWYGAGGAPNRGPGGVVFQDPDGKSGRDVGRELDLEIIWRADAVTTVAAGAAMFSPGSFIRAVHPGVAATQGWGYVSVSRKF